MTPVEAYIRPRSRPRSNALLVGAALAAVLVLGPTTWIVVKHFSGSELPQQEWNSAVSDRPAARKTAPSDEADEGEEPQVPAFVPSAATCQWTASRGAAWLGNRETIDYPLLGTGHNFTTARARRGGEGVPSSLAFRVGSDTKEVVTVANADLLVAKAWAPSASDEWVVGLWAGWARTLTLTTSRLRGATVSTHKTQLDRPNVPDIMSDLYLWIDNAPAISADGCVLRLGYDPTGKNRGKRPVHSTYFSLPASGVPEILSQEEWTPTEHPLYDE